MLGGYLSKFAKICIHSFFNLKNEKVLLEDLWQARKCCWEVLRIELLVVIGLLVGKLVG